MNEANHRPWFLITLAALLLVGAASPVRTTTVPQPPPVGVWVSAVEPESALAHAGLHPKDLLVAWQHPATPLTAAAEGKISSIFDWLWLLTEQAPRGQLSLIGQRDGHPAGFTIQVPVGSWSVDVRPQFAAELVRLYERGANTLADGKVESGIAVWQNLLSQIPGDQHQLLRCWMLLKIGQAWAQSQHWERSQAALESALAEASEPTSTVAIWNAIAGTFARQNQFEQAAVALRSALQVRQQTWPGGLGIASSRYQLGRLALRQGKLDLATDHFEASRNLQLALAPGSLELADSINNLGTVAWYRGELGDASKLYHCALDIRRQLAPGSVHVAASFNNLGLVAWQRGDLDLAEDFQQKAIEIRQELAPDSLEIAASWMNMGNLAWTRGDLVLAEERYLLTLALREKLAPGSLDVALSLNNLGVTAWHRGELALSEAYLQQAFEIRRRLAPNSLDAAASLNNLGVVARIRGDLELARDYYQQSLELRQQLAPDSLDIAATLINLGIVARLRGQFHQAQTHFEDALQLQIQLAPNSLDVAACLTSLGGVLADRGDLIQAERYHRLALEIRQRRAPDSLLEADSLRYMGDIAWQRNHPEARDYYERALNIAQQIAPRGLEAVDTLNSLGVLARERGDLDSARRYFEQSLATLDIQMGNLGGSPEIKGDFRATHGSSYRHLIELHLSQGRAAEAFGVLERSRARSFLEMLAERDLVFSMDVPADLESRRRSNAVLYDRTQQKLSSLSPTDDGEAIDKLLSKLRQLRQERDDIAREVVGTSPQLAALRYPQPLDLEGVQQALDPGTIMLSYSVGKSQTDLFVVTTETFKGIVLPLGVDELRREIELFRRLIQSTDLSTEIATVGKRLYRHLIQPAEALIDANRRILIVADGPLHLLPFAALVREKRRLDVPTRPGKTVIEDLFLAQWRPIHLALSATVYAQLERRRPSPPASAGLLLAAFGDPIYTPDPDPEVPTRQRSLVNRELEPLPSSRLEIERIAEMFPSDRARIFLGAQATEEHVKAFSHQARILHFATHGLLDQRFPLDSGLVLTAPRKLGPTRGNGLLQAWEIFEGMRLNADLVVLSTCESGLGNEQGGEGLIGLTRAFQYAGARSVVSTLWPVEDEMTAELMVRFYRHLQAGLSKVDALQAAQVELIEHPIQVPNADGESVFIDASPPNHWAAFQITGSWR